MIANYLCHYQAQGNFPDVPIENPPQYEDLADLLQEEEEEMPLDDLNAQLVGGGNAADAQLVDDYPEAGPANGELANQIPPEGNILRRSTRNLNPKYTRKKKKLLGLPTSDDDEGIVISILRNVM